MAATLKEKPTFLRIYFESTFSAVSQRGKEYARPFTPILLANEQLKNWLLEKWLKEFAKTNNAPS